MKDYDIISLTTEEANDIMHKCGTSKDFIAVLPKFECRITGDLTLTAWFTYNEDTKTLHVDYNNIAEWDTEISYNSEKSIDICDHKNLKCLNKDIYNMLTEELEIKEGKYKGKTSSIISSHTGLFYAINNYILHLGQEGFNISVEKICHRSSKKSKNKNTKSVVRLVKRYTLKKNWEILYKTHKNIHCPAWGVRGHYRHYKNGNTIFIKAYTKGKYKDKYQSKEYKI